MEDANKMMIYSSRKVETSTVWLLFLFLGWSYGSMGETGKQVAFYLTLGGCGVWSFVRLFTLGGAIKEYNRKVAVEVGLSQEEIFRLGIA
jgi:hypothetical protein